MAVALGLGAGGQALADAPLWSPSVSSWPRRRVASRPRDRFGRYLRRGRSGVAGRGLRHRRCDGRSPPRFLGQLGDHRVQRHQRRYRRGWRRRGPRSGTRQLGVDDRWLGSHGDGPSPSALGCAGDLRSGEGGSPITDRRWRKPVARGSHLLMNESLVSTESEPVGLQRHTPKVGGGMGERRGCGSYLCAAPLTKPTT